MKLNAIKEIDIFGPRIELRLGKKKSHKTYCGASMTIFVGLCCITACIIIGKELILKDNPQVTFRQILADEYNNPNLSEIKQYGSFTSIDLADFNFVLGIKDVNGNDFDANLREKIQIQIHYVEKYGTSLTRVEMPLVGCEQSQIEQFSEEVLDRNAYSCVQSNKAYNLWGEQSDENAHYFEMIAFCEESDCAILSQTMTQLKIHILFKDQYFTPDSYDEAFTPLYRSKYLDFTLSEKGIEGQQNFDFQIQKMTVVTDEGLIQAMLHKTNYICFKQLSKSILSTDQKMLIININLNAFRIVYEDLLAVVGGLMKTLMVIGRFLVKPISKLSLHAELVNELFVFEEQRNRRIKKSFLQMSSINSNNFDFDRMERQTNKMKRQMDIKQSPNAINPQVKHDQRNNNYPIPLSLNPIDNDKQPRSSILKVKTQFYNDSNSHSPSLLPNFFHKIGENCTPRKLQLVPIECAKSVKSNQSLFYIEEQQAKMQLKLKSNFNQNLRQNLNQNGNDSGMTDPSKKQEIFLTPVNGIQSNSSLRNNKVNKEMKYHPKSVASNNSLRQKQYKLTSPLPQANNFDATDMMNNIIINKPSTIFDLNQHNQNLSDSDSNSANEGKQQKDIIQQYESTPKSQIYMNDEIKSDTQKKPQNNQSLYHQDQNTPNNNYDPQLLQIDDQQRGAYKFPSTDSALKQNGYNIKKDQINSNNHFFNNQQNNKQNYQQNEDNYEQNDDNYEKNDHNYELKEENNEEDEDNNKSNGQRRAGSINVQKIKEQQIRQESFIARVKTMGYKNYGRQGTNLITNFLQQNYEVHRGKRKATRKEQTEANAMFSNILDKVHEKPLHFTCFDYIKYYFAKLKCITKKKQIKYSVSKVTQRLDIVYILNKLVEIDKLKVLLLSHQQQKLFEYMPRPVVQADPEAQENLLSRNRQTDLLKAWTLLNSEKGNLDKFTEAFHAYKQISRKYEKEPLDDRLIHMLDPDVKRYFDRTHVDASQISTPHLSSKNSTMLIQHDKHVLQRNSSFKPVSPNLQSYPLNQKPIMPPIYQPETDRNSQIHRRSQSNIDNQLQPQTQSFYLHPSKQGLQQSQQLLNSENKRKSANSDQIGNKQMKNMFNFQTDSIQSMSCVSLQEFQFKNSRSAQSYLNRLEINKQKSNDQSQNFSEDQQEGLVSHPRASILHNNKKEINQFNQNIQEINLIKNNNNNNSSEETNEFNQVDGHQLSNTTSHQLLRNQNQVIHLDNQYSFARKSIESPYFAFDIQRKSSIGVKNIAGNKLIHKTSNFQSLGVPLANSQEMSFKEGYQDSNQNSNGEYLSPVKWSNHRSTFGKQINLSRKKSFSQNDLLQNGQQQQQPQPQQFDSNNNHLMFAQLTTHDDGNISFLNQQSLLAAHHNTNISLNNQSKNNFTSSFRQAQQLTSSSQTNQLNEMVQSNEHNNQINEINEINPKMDDSQDEFSKNDDNTSKYRQVNSYQPKHTSIFRDEVKQDANQETQLLCDGNVQQQSSQSMVSPPLLAHRIYSPSPLLTDQHRKNTLSLDSRNSQSYKNKESFSLNTSQHKDSPLPQMQKFKPIHNNLQNMQTNLTKNNQLTDSNDAYQDRNDLDLNNQNNDSNRQYPDINNQYLDPNKATTTDSVRNQFSHKMASCSSFQSVPEENLKSRRGEIKFYNVHTNKFQDEIEFNIRNTFLPVQCSTENNTPQNSNNNNNSLNIHSPQRISFDNKSNKSMNENRSNNNHKMNRINKNDREQVQNIKFKPFLLSKFKDGQVNLNSIPQSTSLNNSPSKDKILFNNAEQDSQMFFDAFNPKENSTLDKEFLDQIPIRNSDLIVQNNKNNNNNNISNISSQQQINYNQNYRPQNQQQEQRIIIPHITKTTSKFSYQHQIQKYNHNNAISSKIFDNINGGEDSTSILSQDQIVKLPQNYRYSSINFNLPPSTDQIQFPHQLNIANHNQNNSNYPIQNNNNNNNNNVGSLINQSSFNYMNQSGIQNSISNKINKSSGINNMNNLNKRTSLNLQLNLGSSVLNNNQSPQVQNFLKQHNNAKVYESPYTQQQKYLKQKQQEKFVQQLRQESVMYQQPNNQNSIFPTSPFDGNTNRNRDRQQSDEGNAFCFDNPERIIALDNSNFILDKSQLIAETVQNQRSDNISKQNLDTPNIRGGGRGGANPLMRNINTPKNDKNASKNYLSTSQNIQSKMMNQRINSQSIINQPKQEKEKEKRESSLIENNIIIVTEQDEQQALFHKQERIANNEIKELNPSSQTIGLSKNKSIASIISKRGSTLNQPLNKGNDYNITLNKGNEQYLQLNKESMADGQITSTNNTKRTTHDNLIHNQHQNTESSPFHLLKVSEQDNFLTLNSESDAILDNNFNRNKIDSIQQEFQDKYQAKNLSNDHDNENNNDIIKFDDQ